MTLLDFVMKKELAISRAQARRLIQQGAFKISNNAAHDPDQRLQVSDWVEFRGAFYDIPRE